MHKLKTMLTLCLIAFFGYGEVVSKAESPVVFVDDNLKAVVEEILWIDDPTPSDMLDLIELEGVGRDIKDLTGLEHAPNLEVLHLRWNHVSNVEPLRQCERLWFINLSRNQLISDLSPLENVISLKHLDCHDNLISDLGFARNLVNLEYLVLRNNYLTDVSGLAHLTKLEELHLAFNQIVDVSPLANLTKLNELVIIYNEIDDISSLVTLTKMERLSLAGNLIEDISALACMPNLRRLTLAGNQVTDITPLLNLTHFTQVYLTGNSLDEAAYQDGLSTLLERNPGLVLTYDSNPRPPQSIVGQPNGSLGGIRLEWTEVPNGPMYTSYYEVSRCTATSSFAVISDWQTDTTFIDHSVEMGQWYSYRVRCAISPTGEDAGTYGLSQGVKVTPQLAVGSSAGGSVVIPGEGSFSYDESTWVSIAASPADPCLFTFASWSGRAVDERKVEDPHAMSTRVFADGLYDLQANFVSTQSILYVDANVPTSLEYGTLANPFLGIQDAVDVSAAGSTLHIAPGTYEENVYVETEDLTLLGYDPNDTEPVTLPIIDGNGLGPCLTIDSNSVALGFVLTGGESTFSCRGHDVTLSHCLLVGNQSTDPNVGVIDITDSNTAMIHCTVSDNLGTSISLHTSTLSLYNSIVWGVDLESVSLDESSDLSLDHTASSFVWAGTSVFQAEPLFATTGLWQELDDDQWLWQPGDYHLQSVFGRWNPENAQWETDVQTSPYVGAGDRVIWQEQGWSPGENALNCGAYGGTPMASREEF